MAMTSAGMSAAIKTAVQGKFGAPDDPTELQSFCDALGQAIVTYITGNAVVLPGTFSNSSGPVTGTGTVT